MFKFRKINLIGDKGYISELIKNELKKLGINLGGMARLLTHFFYFHKVIYLIKYVSEHP